MTEATHNTETRVYSKETTSPYFPEGYNLHTRRRQNLKSRNLIQCRGKWLLLCFTASNVGIRYV
jgi:hypothetical protein